MENMANAGAMEDHLKTSTQIQMKAVSNSAKSKVLIKRTVYQDILNLFSLEKEDGGILGIKDGIISAFFFNPGTNLDSYHIDTKKFSMVVEEWEEQGIDFIGFVHSHPYGDSEPSLKDFSYLKAFQKANPDLKCIHFPVIYKHNCQTVIDYYVFSNNQMSVVEYLVVD